MIAELDVRGGDLVRPHQRVDLPGKLGVQLPRRRRGEADEDLVAPGGAEIFPRKLRVRR